MFEKNFFWIHLVLVSSTRSWVAQKRWPKRSGLLWPYHLRNKSKSSWNAFLLSAIRGFYQNNISIYSFFVHFCSIYSFSETSVQLLHFIHIASCLASHILLTLKKWELYLLRWLKTNVHDVGSGDQTCSLGGQLNQNSKWDSNYL